MLGAVGLVVLMGLSPADAKPLIAEAVRMAEYVQFVDDMTPQLNERIAALEREKDTVRAEQLRRTLVLYPKQRAWSVERLQSLRGPLLTVDLMRKEPYSFAFTTIEWLNFHCVTDEPSSNWLEPALTCFARVQGEERKLRLTVHREQK